MNDDEKRFAKADSDADWLAVKMRKLWRKRIIILSIALAVVLLFGVFTLVGYNSAKKAAEAELQELREYVDTLENEPYVLNRVTPQIVMDQLAESYAETGKLISAEYLFTNAAKFTDTSNIIEIFDWMTEKSFVQKWDGCIMAGIDLSEVSASVNKDVITITVPEAEILSYEVNYDSVEIFNEMNNVFNPISVKDKASFDKKTAEAMKKRAISNGLLDSAQKNAETVIKDLLYNAVPGAANYTFEFVVAVPEE